MERRSHMKKVIIVLLLSFVSLAAFAGSFASFQVHSTASAFVGFLDTYAGATWGISTFKLTNAYGGNWGTVERQSDSTTQVIGFLSNGKADTATFSSFCANTNCFATSLVDQVNSINASQATIANMPRVIVNANGNLSVCGTPTSSMSTAFNSAVNTAKQHLFVVAKAGYGDNRSLQADIPQIAVTGSTTNGSATLSAMTDQVGISTATGNGAWASHPGVFDSKGAIPNPPTTGTVNQAQLLALPTGTTATMGPSGIIGATSSQTNDTLTFENAVTQGAWIINGPASASYGASAYWGMGFDAAAGGTNGAATLSFIRNTTLSTYQNFIGNGMRGLWSVYDYDTNTGHLGYNGTDLGNAGSAAVATITYSTNVGMTLFANANGTENASNNCFETMVLFSATQASRVAQAQFLMAQDSVSFPFAPNTSDGFAMTGNYMPLDSFATTGVYGNAQSNYGPDANGSTFIAETGGYTWPSSAFANNINNGAGALWRFIVQQGDSDININENERSEVDLTNTTGQFASGQSMSLFYQFEFEQLPTQTGNWCFSGQLHYAPGVIPPDLVTFSCLNGQIQFILQCCDGASSPALQNCGAAQTLTVGTTYAVEIELVWSAGGTTDKAQVNFGTNGTTLSQLCNVGPSTIFNASGTRTANMKAGLYRGFPWANPGTAILRVMNIQTSHAANAFSSFIASQPALPTHPFLLKRDLDPASNDNTPMWLNEVA